MTNKERKVYDFLVDFQDLTGVFPSFKTIQYEFRFKSPASVSQYLDQLHKKGLVEKFPSHTYRLKKQ